MGDPKDLEAIIQEFASGKFLKPEHENLQNAIIRERGYDEPHINPGLIVCPKCGAKHLMFVWQCVVCNYVFYRR